jgi:hypothetical protein
MAHRTSLVLVCVVVLLASGCGGDDPETATPSLPITTTAAVTTTEPPGTTASGAAPTTTVAPQPLEPGVDWMRIAYQDGPFAGAALGDVIAGPFGWVISGVTGEEGRLGVWTSPDGVAWTAVEPTAFIGATDDIIMVDGLPQCWTTSRLQPSGGEPGPPLATDGSVVLVGCSNSIWWSEDGTTWNRAAVETPSYYLPPDEPRGSAVSLKLPRVQAIAHGPSGWAAVGRGVYGTSSFEVSHTLNVWVSADGRNWTLPEENMEQFWSGGDWYEGRLQAVTATQEGWLAAGTIHFYETGEDGVLWTSVDGRMYTPVGGDPDNGPLDAPDNQGVISLISGDGGYLAVGWDATDSFRDGGASARGSGSAAVWTSTDRGTWSRVDSDSFTGDGYTVMMDVVAADSGYVAVGAEFIERSDTGVVWYTADGAGWQRVTGTHPDADQPKPLAAIAAGPQGFVAVGGGGVWASGSFDLPAE